MDISLETAQQYLKGEKLQQAFEIYKELLVRDPTVPEAWFGISQCISDMSLQKRCLNNAILLKPDFQEAKDILIKLSQIPNEKAKGDKATDKADDSTVEVIPENKQVESSENTQSNNSLLEKDNLYKKTWLKSGVLIVIGVPFIILGIIMISRLTQLIPSQVKEEIQVNDSILYFPPSTPDINLVVTQPIDESLPTSETNTTITNCIEDSCVLFSDDFSNRDWTVAQWEIEEGAWEIVKDRLAFIKNGKAFAGNYDWDDYSYSVDMMGINTIDKILFFRYTDNLHTYYVFLRSHPINDILLAKTTPSQPDQILISKPYKNNYSVWYKVKVEAIGNHIQVYVDGTLVIDYYDNDSPLLTGRIALVGMLPENGTVFYDNVLVEGK